MYCTFFLLMVLLTPSCYGQEPMADQVELTILRIVASTTFGNSVGAVRAVLSSVGPNEQYTREGENIAFEHIPFGVYDLELRAPGFKAHRERLGLYQAEVSYHVGLVVALPHSSKRTEISGLVLQVPKDASNLWIRLVSLYAGDLIEGRLDTRNRFRFVGISPGRYVLLLLDKGRVLDTQTVEFFGGTLALKVSGARAKKKTILGNALAEASLRQL